MQVSEQQTWAIFLQYIPILNSISSFSSSSFFLHVFPTYFYRTISISVVLFQGNTNFIIAYYFNSLPKFIILVFACGIAYGVSLAVGFLLVMQVSPGGRGAGGDKSAQTCQIWCPKSNLCLLYLLRWKITHQIACFVCAIISCKYSSWQFAKKFWRLIFIR